jgi:uncharacterized protein (TIGR03067 family)
VIRWLQSLLGSSADSEPVTLEALQGKWKMVGVGKNGRFAPASFLANAKIYMTIQGDMYSVTNNGTLGDQGIIKLDTNQTPVHFDQYIQKGEDAGDIHLGIVRFKDGVLENFQAENGSPRPNKFVTKWSDGASLAKFRRVSTTQ